MEEEQQLQQPGRLKRFWRESVRVLRATKKPSKVEYRSALKVTALGIALLGVIGFVIFLIVQILF